MSKTVSETMQFMAKAGDDIFEGLMYVSQEIDKLNNRLDKLEKKGIATTFNPIPSITALSKRIERLEERGK